MKPTVIIKISAVLLLAVFFLKAVNMTPTCKLTNVICESKNQSWITVEHCRLRAVSRNLTTLNINVTFLHPANDIHLRYRMWKKANGYKPFLFDYRVDVCAFLRKANHPFIKIWSGAVKQYSTFNHTCPFVGKNVVNGFHWDPRNVTLPLPSGEYVSLFTWIFDKKPQIETNIYFTFKQDLLKD